MIVTSKVEIQKKNKINKSCESEDKKTKFKLDVEGRTLLKWNLKKKLYMKTGAKFAGLRNGINHK